MPDHHNHTLENIARLRYMLEYMTLCADPTLFEARSVIQPHPIPSGIPMGIVILPDFVVDIAIDSLVDSTATNRGQIEALDVGGRAGRLTCALQAFGGERYGWYNIKYLAKAGGIGRVVLQRRFGKGHVSAGTEPVSLRYIVPSKADRDWLHIYGGASKTVESSSSGLQVDIGDFEYLPYSLADLTLDARYIVVSSKHGSHAIDALALLSESLTRVSAAFKMSSTLIDSLRVPIGILLDISALSDPNESSKVVDAFSHLKARQNAFEIESTVLLNNRSADIPRIFDYTLVRSSDQITLGSTVTAYRCGSNPIAREAFTAGYVIASACSLGWRLLRLWLRRCPSLRPIDGRLHKTYPTLISNSVPSFNQASEFLPTLSFDASDPVSPDDRLDFATALAVHDESRHLSYRDLVKAVTLSGQTAVRGVVKQESDFACANTADLDAMKVTLDGPSDPSLLIERFGDGCHRNTYSLFLPPSNIATLVNSCLLRDVRTTGSVDKHEIDKAVMFDLDATLLDSEGLRQACWFNGLHTLFRDAGVTISADGIQTALELYEVFIYKNFELFRTLLKDHPDIPPEWQPCDFRQVWNHRYAWAALVFVFDCFHGSKWSAQSWADVLRKHSGDTGCECSVCQQLNPMFDRRERSIQERRQITESLRYNLTRFKFPIQAARAAFWEVDYPCYAQARAAVEMLRATPGCEVYVVTEGHEETQIKKLACTGLADLFPRNRVLSTGAASAAEDARSNLEKLLRSNQQAKADLQLAMERVRSGARNELDLLVRKREATIASILFLMDCLNGLYKKGHRRFYSAVVEAIRLDPESPARVLQSFLRKDATGDIEPARAMRFLMVGDRYDNDCKPLLEMFPSTDPSIVGVGTCRILSGKRAKKHCPPGTDNPSTLLVCDTLAQVSHIMHASAMWNRIAVLKDVTPPVLLELNGDIIFYGTQEGNASLEELGPRFRDLCWAREDEILMREHAVQDMLNQVERDLAVCTKVSLVRLFASVRHDIDTWVSESQKQKWDPQEPEVKLIKGAFKLLSGVNYWRHRLRRPLLQLDEFPVPHSLEWILVGLLLHRLSILTMQTPSGVLRATQGSISEEIKPREVLDSIPYSGGAKMLLQRLLQYHRNHIAYADRRQIEDWLVKVNDLPVG